MAPYFAEDRLLEFAATCEHLIGWRPTPPEYGPPVGPPAVSAP